MKSVQSAHKKVGELLEKFENLEKIKTFIQDENYLIRYTKNKDFNDIVAKSFLERNDSYELIKKCIDRVKNNESHPLNNIYDLS